MIINNIVKSLCVSVCMYSRILRIWNPQVTVNTSSAQIVICKYYCPQKEKKKKKKKRSSVEKQLIDSRAVAANVQDELDCLCPESGDVL